MTEFENEMIASILWQIKGLRENEVSQRATKRILRASLRRISAKHIGSSIEAEAINLKPSLIDIDHVIPVNVITNMILAQTDINKKSLVVFLGKYHCTAKITKQQHTQVLKEAGLSSKMPKDWDSVDLLARYSRVGIIIK